MGIWLFSQIRIDRMRGNSLKLCQGRFRLNIGKNFFTEKVVKLWERLLRSVVESLSLERSKRCADEELGDLVQWWPLKCWGNGLT